MPSRSLRSTSSSIVPTWWRRSRWTVGSSRTRTGVAWATARASSTSCRSPSDSSRASRPSRCPTPTRSIAAAIAARSAGRAPRNGSSCGSRPRATTSSTRVANGSVACCGHDGQPPGDRVRDRARSIGVAAERRPAGGRPDEPGDDAQQRRLAGAVRPDQRDPLARRDVEVDAADDRPGRGTSTRDVAQLDHSSYPVRDRRSRNRKNGAPMTAVTTPTGISPSSRAARSAKASSAAPPSADSGRTSRAFGPTMQPHDVRARRARRTRSARSPRRPPPSRATPGRAGSPARAGRRRRGGPPPPRRAAAR